MCVKLQKRKTAKKFLLCNGKPKTAKHSNLNLNLKNLKEKRHNRFFIHNIFLSSKSCEKRFGFSHKFANKLKTVKNENNKSVLCSLAW